jgi:hypothetical protein
MRSVSLNDRPKRRGGGDVGRRRSHVIADISMRSANPPCWVRCSCGERFEAPSPQGISDLYEKHTGVKPPELDLGPTRPARPARGDRWSRPWATIVEANAALGDALDHGWPIQTDRIDWRDTNDQINAVGRNLLLLQKRVAEHMAANP